MSEEDLELLVTLDDPGDAEDDVHRAEAVIDDDPYKVTFGQDGWTCTLARFTGTTNDSMQGLGGNIFQPPDKKFEIEVCTVTHWENGEVVEQRVFYDLGGMPKHFGGR